MTIQIRDLVASALYPTSANVLPAVCERLGMAPGDRNEAMASKRSYVMSRLEKLSEEKVFLIAKRIVEENPDEKLKEAVERIEREGHLITGLTRTHIARALNPYDLAGSEDLFDLLRQHWPTIDRTESIYNGGGTLADDIARHAVGNPDWGNAELLRVIGFPDCSQSELLRFLEDVVHPARRSQAEQEKLVAELNAILSRDGFKLVPEGAISGYPKYRAREVTATGSAPPDRLISDALLSFDEGGVHEAWRKALERRTTDPEGAITAARTLMETVCKHILDASGATYGDNDDLPKLYGAASELLNLAPSQHSEPVFSQILGNCHSVVNNLAGLRNKLGDSHGQGKRHVKPLPRHAELAVNLAGSMAMFLVSTWDAKNPGR